MLLAFIAAVAVPSLAANRTRRTAGTVWAWGYNVHGELGNGTNTNSTTPVQVSGLSGVTAIAGGYYHGLALKTDGTVWAWGSNAQGQLGNGTNTDSTTPVQVSGLSGVVAIAAGWYNNLALKSDGTVWAWGYNSNGQLGNGNYGNSTVPVQVADVNDVTGNLTGVVAIAAGQQHCLALKSDGTLWAWGWNAFGQLGDGGTGDSTLPNPATGLSGVVAIAGGGMHSLATTSDGKLWAWGYNANGQLGDGTTTLHYSPQPVVLSVGGPAFTGVVSIAAGRYGSRAVKSDGTVWTWGYATNELVPTQVAGLAGAVSAAASEFHSVVLESDGTVWGWGNNSYGQLGDGTIGATATPVPANISGVVAVATEGDYTLALQSDAGWAAWGYNANGQFGNGTYFDSYTPAQVSSASTFTALAAGVYHSWGLKSNGTVSAWGYNAFGQLGDGTTTDRNTPLDLTNVSGAAAIAAGDWHSLALESDGSVWACGRNLYGQLGIPPTTAYSATPLPVSGLPAVTAISAGSYHSLALSGDGTVWAWGYNYYGQLGNGSGVDSSTPVQVQTLTNVVAIAAGGNHSLALTSDGKVWAWGHNPYGELGDGSVIDKYTPTLVSTLAGAISVSAGVYHSVALKSDGTVWAWGYNLYGELGDGTTTDRTTPVQVTGLSGAVSVDAHWYHSVAVKSDGNGWAWGFNANAQLGDGTLTDRSTPVPVIGLSDVAALTAGGYHSLALTSTGLAPAPPLDHFEITPSTTTPVTGIPFSVTVTAKDANGNVLTSYSGTVHFSLSNTDAGATLPSDYSFVAGDNGAHTFTDAVTLSAPGLQTINISDTVQTGAIGSVSVDVFVVAADLELSPLTADSYGAVVTNNGPSDATNVVLTDTLDRFTYVSYSASRGTCSFAAGVLTCNLGTIGKQGNVSVTVTATPPASGWATHAYAVTATQADPNPANNSLRLGPGMTSNRLPIADAGTNLVLPGASPGGATIRLDARASSDPDGDPLTYRWTGPFAEGGGTATGMQPQVTLPLGPSRVSLVVNDGKVDSSPVSIVVTISDFDIALPQNAANITRGGSAAFTVSVSPKFGRFDAPITLSCPSLPAGITCSFTPASVSPGAQSATATVTVSAAGLAALVPATPHRGSYAVWLVAFGAFGALLINGPRRRRLWLTLALMLIVVVAQFACGGGGAQVTPVPQSNLPSTSLAVTISGASGSLAHSTTAIVTVR